MIEDVWRNPFPQATPEQAKKKRRHSRESGNPFCLFDQWNKINMDSRFRGNDDLSSASLTSERSERPHKAAQRPT
jgi:hypothetical protein